MKLGGESHLDANARGLLKDAIEHVEREKEIERVPRCNNCGRHVHMYERRRAISRRKEDRREGKIDKFWKLCARLINQESPDVRDNPLLSREEHLQGRARALLSSSSYHTRMEIEIMPRRPALELGNYASATFFWTKNESRARSS